MTTRREDILRRSGQFWRRITVETNEDFDGRGSPTGGSPFVDSLGIALAGGTE